MRTTTMSETNETDEFWDALCPHHPHGETRNYCRGCMMDAMMPPRVAPSAAAAEHLAYAMHVCDGASKQVGSLHAEVYHWFWRNLDEGYPPDLAAHHALSEWKL